MKLSARIMTAMLALVLLTSLAVGLLTTRKLEAAILPTELNRLEAHTQTLTSELANYVNRVRADVLMLARTPAVAGIIRAQAAGGIDPLDRSAAAVWHERLAQLFSAMLAPHPEYVQFRLIGVADGGRELVCVDRSGPGAALRNVPAAELERKGEKPYFKQALSIPVGEVYVSPIELNREQGPGQTPQMPVVRVATLVQDLSGQPFGILIVNLNMQPAFERLRAAMRSNHNIYLINAQGDYLVHPQPAREFGLELGHAYQVQDEFPELKGAGTTQTTAVKTLQAATGQKMAVALRPLRLLDQTSVVLLETVPYQALLSAALSVRQSSLLAGLVATLVAVLLALVLTRSLTQPLVKMTAAVDAFRGDEPLEVPLHANGELGVLARAFARMSVEVQEKTAALKAEITERRRAETEKERYAERDRLYSTLVESSNDAILTKTLEGTITGWNPAAEQLYGYTAQEAIGQNINLLVPDNRRADTELILDTLRRGKSLTHFETKRVSKDGRLLDVSLTISPVKSATQSLTGASEIARNVTQQKQAEDKFRLAVEAAPSGVVMVDSKGQIILVNAETERLFDYPRAELIGQSIELLVPARFQNIHAQQRGAFITTPETRRMGVGRNLFGRRKNGSEFPIEIGLNPIQTSEGLLVLSVIVDITERKAAEERFQLVVEAAPSGMVMVDDRGKIIMVNAETERLFGYQREELIGQSVEIFVPPRFRQRHPDSRLGYQSAPKVRSMGAGRDLYGLRKDGSEFPVEIGLNPISTPAGMCTLTTILDITERKLAEEALRAAHNTLEAKVVERTMALEAAYLQLKEVDRLKSEFLATMSHELRTPLNSIIGFTGILLQGLPGPLNDEQHKQLNMVHASGKHLLGLISDLLDLSRIESGKVEIERQPVNLEEVVTDVCNTVGPLARQKKLQLKTEFPTSLPVINSDRKRIFQVLLNLAGNAVKFTDTGEVKITGVHQNGFVKLTVSDTGIGIRPENFPMLFEAFRQIDGSSQRRYEGAGLGLHLSKRLVELLGGKIEAESEYGRGSKFSLTLPLNS
jgi:PAS domain S-box-containing protein